MLKVTVIGIAVCSIIIGLGVWGYTAFQHKKNAMYNATLKGLQTGKVYGKHVRDRDCTYALKVQYSQCSDTNCEVGAHGFIAGCMGEAKVTEYCQQAPSPDNTTASLNWVDNECKSLGLENTRCENYMHKALDMCYEHNSGRERDNYQKLKDGFKKGFLK